MGSRAGFQSYSGPKKPFFNATRKADHQPMKQAAHCMIRLPPGHDAQANMTRVMGFSHSVTLAIIRVSHHSSNPSANFMSFSLSGQPHRIPIVKASSR